VTRDDATDLQDYDRDESIANRSMPRIRISLQPLNFLQFAFGLIESWVITRNYPKMLGGLPFLAMTTLGIGCYWWVRHSSIEPVLQQYHARFDKAVAEKDIETEETCLRALCNLQPSVPEYRMRLGLYFFDRGEKEKAIYEIIRLAPESTTGFPAARLWLVQQAIGPEPLIRMSREEVENQLIKVLDAKPDHVDAHQMLAALYLDARKLREAELHLEEAAKIRPELNLQLAQIKKQMKRPGDDTDAAAAKAVTELSRLLEKDRSRVDVRLGLAEALLLVENFDQAREIIVSGLLQKDDAQLRNALVDLDLMSIDRRLKSSVLNRDACVPIALNALKIAPGNPRCINTLSLLRSLGATIPPEPLAVGVEFWKKELEQKPAEVEPRMYLSELLFMLGEKTVAVETLRPAVPARPALRLTMARLLFEVGDDAGAQKLLYDLLRETSKRLIDAPGDLLVILERAEAMLLLKRPDDVRSMINDFKETDTPETPKELDNAVMDLYGRACLMKFDELTGYSTEVFRQITQQEALNFGTAEGEEIIGLAEEAAQIPGTSLSGIERLARLSLSSHPAAAASEDTLRRLRFEGQAGIIALNQIGSHAMRVGNFEKAIFWYEQGNNLAAARNPVILNNLATAVIRGRPNQAADALRYANETLALLPGNGDALATRGEVHLTLKKYDNALADLTESLRNRPGTAEVHRLLALAYQGLGDEQMAQEHLKRAAELRSEKESS
jgi:tetratricopeptide (TPR) repeat protein